MQSGFLSENLKGGDHYGHLTIDRRVSWWWILNIVSVYELAL
jgi:hypothetical protein